MSERKWTPGPWSVKHDRGIRAADGACVASTYVAAPLADAHLIAAAPDLYEALERSVKAWTDDVDRMGPMIRQALAALAKARGEA